MSNEIVEVYEVKVDDRAQNEANRLAKKKRFTSLPAQMIELIDDFERGNFSGDNILTYDEPTRIEVYKLRLPNPDANAGKSNGYRVVYAIAIERKLVTILTIYYKKEIATLPESEIRGMLNAFIAKYLPEQSETNDENAAE
jgi:mRNA-degrading endonuclease RelE of RelBE toxin-antitoxin system